MIDDITLAKLAVIRRCLQRIQRKTGGDPEIVDDIDIQDIVVLNLQRAIQATIDLAAHLITIHQWGLPASLKEHFTLLAGQGIIDRELSRHLEAMVGFRNIAVHEYQALDVAILKPVGWGEERTPTFHVGDYVGIPSSSQPTDLKRLEV